MLRSSFSSPPLAALAALVLGSHLAFPLQQGPGTRLKYRIRILEPAATGPRVLASGSVIGPLDTDMRLTLRSDSAEIEALFQVTPVGDTVNLSAEFFTRRRVGRSRRGLHLWEQDTYRRVARLSWSDTARVYPFGSSRRASQLRAPWVELVLERDFTGGVGRPAEEVQLADPLHDFRLEAVVSARRARVTLNLVRGDTVSGPRPMDLVREEPPRLVQLVAGRYVRTLEVSLVRAPAPRSVRERVLALDADIVCLRIAVPDGAQPIGVLCGRLTNVARRLPLPTGDTLVASLAWPGPR